MQFLGSLLQEFRLFKFDQPKMGHIRAKTRLTMWLAPAPPPPPQNFWKLKKNLPTNTKRYTTVMVVRKKCDECAKLFGKPNALMFSLLSQSLCHLKLPNVYKVQWRGGGGGSFTWPICWAPPQPYKVYSNLSWNLPSTQYCINNLYF